MTGAQFDKIVEHRIEEIRRVLVSKGQEYANDRDRMLNFKTGAAIQGVTPIECLRGYMTKHVSSVYNMLQYPDKFTPEQWEEKIGDTINYLILLEALLKEEP